MRCLSPTWSDIKRCKWRKCSWSPLLVCDWMPSPGRSDPINACRIFPEWFNSITQTHVLGCQGSGIRTPGPEQQIRHPPPGANRISWKVEHGPKDTTHNIFDWHFLCCLHNLFPVWHHAHSGHCDLTWLRSKGRGTWLPAGLWGGLSVPGGGTMELLLSWKKWLVEKVGGDKREFEMILGGTGGDGGRAAMRSSRVVTGPLNLFLCFRSLNQAGKKKKIQWGGWGGIQLHCFFTSTNTREKSKLLVQKFLLLSFCSAQLTEKQQSLRTMIDLISRDLSDQNKL